jgi:hypothetical protein
MRQRQPVQAKTAVKTRRPAEEILFIARMSETEARRIQRLAKEGTLQRLRVGVYGPAGDPTETAALVQRNWQLIAGDIAPGAVVSHVSAALGGMTPEGRVTLSHPTIYNVRHTLPGLTIALYKGPSQLAGDMRLANTGLFWASRARWILENLGPATTRRIGTVDVEKRLVDILNASGEAKLNEIRDQAERIAEALGARKQTETLQRMIGALLGTHSIAELHTRDGQLAAKGLPVDQERRTRFEILASHLRTVSLPSIADVADSGVAKVNFAFVEAYFSNYVEGTKFPIEQAEDIALRNRIVAGRPKDSHDLIGVFRLAQNSPFRNAPPPPGIDFLEALQQWHARMLANRPEVQPGEIKTTVNVAGNSRFVEPALVRGTMAECSQLALSIPEGLARAIFYGFLVSEIHPFTDGNGRLSRLLMNAELSRLGLCRVIIPTLYHPQYVDCAKQLTLQNEPTGYVDAIAKMARWCAQFDYSDVKALIEQLRRTNALEESLIRFKLLNLDGSGVGAGSRVS